MIKHVRGRFCQNFQCGIHSTPEVRRQDFDLNIGIKLSGLLDTVDEMLGATIAQVIPVDRGNNHVAQTHPADCFRQVRGFPVIERIRAPVPHITKRASPGTDIAHNHKSSGALGKAFPQIWAGCLFADGKKIIFPQD